MIQEVLRLNIQAKLNDNADNLHFELGSYANVDGKNTEKDFIYNVDNGYQLIETSFVPVMMTFEAEYEPIPNQINGTATINLDFLVESEPLEQSVFDSKINNISELVSKVVGNIEDIIDGTKTYHTVWTMTGIAPGNVTKPLNGIYYTSLTTTITIDFSDTYFYGNKYNTIKLDNTSIVVLDGEVSRNNEENNPHLLGNNEAKGGNEESVWSCRITTYVDLWLETNILKKISDETYDMNEVFAYEETIAEKVHTFNVVIKGVARSIVYGEKQKVSFTIYKTDISS